MQLERYAVRTSENHSGYMFVSYDPVTGNISDTTRSNNGDRDKVFATVAVAATDFLKCYPEATIFVKGSTATRTRMYQMGINRFYEEITDKHELFGFRNDEWEEFEQNAQYEAFRIRRK